MSLIYKLLLKDIKYKGIKYLSSSSSSSLPLSTKTSSSSSSSLLSRIRNPFRSNYDNSLIYEKNYSKKSGKAFIARTIDYVTGKKATELENDDIALLEKLIILPKSLSSLSIDIDHPLHNIANNIRNSIKYNVNMTSDFNNIRVKITIENIINILEENFNTNKINIINYYYDDNWNIINNNDINIINKQNTTLRILNYELYLKNLLKLLVNGDLDYSKITENKLLQLSDAFLLGKSSDRIVEHLSLYSLELNQWQLQDSFYQIYEQEILAVAKIFLLVRGLRQVHYNTIPKYSSSYLLDVLDLNMKSRCVFSWSDPNFTGLKPLPDDHIIPINSLMISRRLYFNDSLDIGATFAKEYLGSRRAVYTDKKDTKDTLRNGFYFLIVTCLLDWGVCLL